ncbi:MAG: zinc dependent phospholipase C family protein [Desulfitobacteriaceae bacterium]
MLVEKAIGIVVKMILTPAGPLQHLLDATEETHVRFLEQAHYVLIADGKADVAAFFQQYQSSLSKGVLWADQGWKNVGHYYSQPGRQGILRWPGAASECQYYFNKALTTFRNDREKGMFYLGAALHVVQDMCVPHHSLGMVFDGHQEFEKWAYRHWDEFLTARHGFYLPFTHPIHWIEHNANISAPYYHLVSLEKGCNERSYIKAAKELLPFTIRTTAGFLNFAKECIEEQ